MAHLLAERFLSLLLFLHVLVPLLNDAREGNLLLVTMQRTGGGWRETALLGDGGVEGVEDVEGVESVAGVGGEVGCHALLAERDEIVKNLVRDRGGRRDRAATKVLGKTVDVVAIKKEKEGRKVGREDWEGELLLDEVEDENLDPVPSSHW